MMNITAKKLSVICCLLPLLYSASGLAIPQKKSLVMQQGMFVKNKYVLKKYHLPYEPHDGHESLADGADDREPYVHYNRHYWRYQEDMDKKGEPIECGENNEQCNSSDYRAGKDGISGYKNVIGNESGADDKNGPICRGGFNKLGRANGHMCLIAPADYECELTAAGVIADRQMIKLFRHERDPKRDPDRPGVWTAQGDWWMYWHNDGISSWFPKGDYHCWKYKIKRGSFG